MFRYTCYLPLALAAALIGAPRPAAAQQLQRFDDRSAFSAAAGPGLTNHSFEELTDSELYQQVTYPDVMFHSTDGDQQDLMAVSPDSFSFPALHSRVLLSQRNYNPIVMEFTPAVASVGFDVVALPTGVGAIVTVEGTDGVQTLDLPMTDGGPVFIGLKATTGQIIRVSVSNVADQQAFVGVDDVSSTSQVAAPPAPSDPVMDCLDQLAAVIAQGRADGSISRCGDLLAYRVQRAKEAWQGHNRFATARELIILGIQVHAPCGCRYMPVATEQQIFDLIRKCLSLLS